MLEIRDLHVQFHGSDHEAVRGIDLTVGDGEIVGLVGESGSGKTVTAMMISGLLRPEQASFRGQILLDGRDLLTSSGDTLRSIQGRDICVVFQEPMSAMDPTMRIGPQVEECLRVHTDLPPKRRRELALQALRDVDLPDAEEVYRKYPHELSGGMLQRVMIAAAILPQPRLLLADEPVASLDPVTGRQILELLRDIQQDQKLTVLMNSHNLELSQEFSSRLIGLNQGTVVLDAPADTPAEDILAAGYDGVMLSNGPGDPTDNISQIAEITKLFGRIPMFGICLGHQLMALAQGGSTVKLKYGHRGVNQPARDVCGTRTFLTSQNHGYAVVPESVKTGVIRYVNANDGTCEGIDYPDLQAFSVQFHPEACSGPHDTAFLFDRFCDLMGGAHHAD